jgi:predicted transcriptional regulator
MPLGDDKTTVTAVISSELKDRLKHIAKLRRWTLSQAVGALIEDSLEKWVDDLGIVESANKSPKKRSSKSVS